MITDRPLISPDALRSRFSQAMSRMYRAEVPAYGTLMELVADVNAGFLAGHADVKAGLDKTESLERISEERHGAIRLGTPAELAQMRRAFAVMGMFPVGYYDLSVAGIPVHSTAFRPIHESALKKNPFRVFTSLLRLDLLADEALRSEAESALAKRQIFSPQAMHLIEKAEQMGGLKEPDAEIFIREVLETFRWHNRAIVSHDLYQRLHKAHRLVADVVSFKGPHINHLTPRVLDIELVQTLMPGRGITPKEVIEGPPARICPILLRQTSFKALEEPISFEGTSGDWIDGSHSARFGEIEQRGAALTPKGRALYDQLLGRALRQSRNTNKGGADETLEIFSAFPDSYAEMREQGLAYFEYVLTDAGQRAADDKGASGSLDALIQAGFVTFHPIAYEDFLPVSAAGIFQSNLGADAAQDFVESPNKPAFEAALGTSIIDEHMLYAAMEQASVSRCLEALAYPRSISSAKLREVRP